MGCMPSNALIEAANAFHRRVAFAEFGIRVAAVMTLRDRDDDNATDLDVVADPLTFGPALSFGTLLAFVLLALHYLDAWFGNAGVHVVAALSGVIDIDAITISVVRLVGDDLAVNAVATVISVATAVNTTVKAGIAIGMDGKTMGLRVGSIYAVSVTVDVEALWFAIGWG